MLSQSGQYAIRAMVALAQEGGRTPTDAAKLARILNLPTNYLAKILQTLVRDGLLSSLRGLHGGYAIAREPDEISLLSIVEPFENLIKQKACLMGRAKCSVVEPSPLHERWRPVVEAYLDFLTENTLGDLIPGARSART